MPICPAYGLAVPHTANQPFLGGVYLLFPFILAKAEDKRKE